MAYETLLQQTSPFLLLLLGLLLLAGGRALGSDKFLQWIAGGFILSGLGLGLQSMMDDGMLTQTAPFVSILYLTGAMAATHGTAIRCGDGPLRSWFVWGLNALCLTGSAWFSYMQPDILVRIMLLNGGLGLIYLSQLPYLYRSWGRLARYDRLIGGATTLIGLCHLLRTVYVACDGQLMGISLGMPVTEGVNLTQSVEWRLLLALTNLVCLSFGFLALLSAAQDRLSNLSMERDIDPLTGLLNRRSFFEQARKRIANGPEHTWAIVAADVDFFKNINDVWGHSIGDQALVRIAGVLQHQTRPQDLVARFGGEEFIMLVGGQDFGDAVTIAERTREVVALSMVPGLPQRVTASFGVAQLPDIRHAGVDFALDQALAAADRHLYAAKTQGRNRVVVAGRTTEIMPIVTRETLQPA